eukprot:m.287628 g.287628  ORF g.287628 m.287628 type:complete len:134 (+) comp55022_c0_seq4:1125-1526(+)
MSLVSMPPKAQTYPHFLRKENPGAVMSSRATKHKSDLQLFVDPDCSWKSLAFWNPSQQQRTPRTTAGEQRFNHLVPARDTERRAAHCVTQYAVLQPSCACTMHCDGNQVVRLVIHFDVIKSHQLMPLCLRYPV